MCENSPERTQDEPAVQGLPHGLVSSLCGVGCFLLLAGAACALFAAREHLEVWVQVALLLALPLVIFVAHVRRAGKRGEPVFSWAFAALLGAHVVLLPLCMVLSFYVSLMLGDVCLAVYASIVIWYGAFYSNTMAISAGCTLAALSTMSIPLFYGAVVSAVLLILLGGGILFLAYQLHRRRAAQLAYLQVLRKRRQISAEQAPPKSQD